MNIILLPDLGIVDDDGDIEETLSGVTVVKYKDNELISSEIDAVWWIKNVVKWITIMHLTQIF